MFGKLLDYCLENQKVTITFEKRKARIEIITDTIWNVFADFSGKESASLAVEGDKSQTTAFHVCRESDGIVIETKSVTAKIYDNFKIDFYDQNGQLKCADYRGKREYFCPIPKEAIEMAKREGHDMGIREDYHYGIEVIKTVAPKERFYGLGDKAGFLDKRGYDYEMWNVDNPDPHNEQFKSLYKSIPFYMSLSDRGTYGIFFDNTYHTYFDMAKENDQYCFLGADEGNLNYYYFGGATLKDILTDYTYLTGRTPMPQLWTLGYQQSRWGYVTEDQVREIAKNMRKWRIPCDVIHLDIDYMDGYRVFTWNKDHYKDPKKMISDLAKDGFKIVTIIDPAVKKDENYKKYQEAVENGYFATTPEGEIYENAVWPGTSCFPDFGKNDVQQWWADNHKYLVDMGVRGIWNDMDEPASFRGELPSDVVFHLHDEKTNHAEMHNVYGHLMSQATFDGMKKYDGRRPFVITRACYSGTQKYSTAWTGDNTSIWAHLRLVIPQLCSLGLSGIDYVGTDIGGFGSDTTKELLCRWIQIGVFSPLCRNHCAPQRYQEPWEFDEETIDIYRTYVKLRYKLIPYLYDLFRESELTGMPLMRPLVLEYPDDANTEQLNDEVLVGSNILVAPVVEQGQNARMVYLPEGRWMDYHTNEMIEGPTRIVKEAPLSICPIYVKYNAMIPQYEEQEYVGEKEQRTLIIKITGDAAAYTHYQDDGESFDYQNGVYNEYAFAMNEKQEFTAVLKHRGYEKTYQAIEIHYQGKTSQLELTDGTKWKIQL